jgi:hypothetical protein
MDDSYILILIISGVLGIIILIKFFQIASDLKSINEKFKFVIQLANDVRFIKNRNDGELNYLTEDRSKGEIQFLIVNGYKEEARRMLLRKVWTLKSEISYEELKQEYNNFFIKIGEAFPSEDVFGKTSNPV